MGETDPEVLAETVTAKLGDTAASSSQPATFKTFRMVIPFSVQLSVLRQLKTNRALLLRLRVERHGQVQEK